MDNFEKGYNPMGEQSVNYRMGYLQGLRDMRLLCDNRPNTNGYTYSEYLRVKEEVEHAVYSHDPTDWQLGYGHSTDIVSCQHGMKNQEMCNGKWCPYSVQASAPITVLNTKQVITHYNPDRY